MTPPLSQQETRCACGAFFPARGGQTRCLDCREARARALARRRKALHTVPADQVEAYLAAQNTRLASQVVNHAHRLAQYEQYLAKKQEARQS